MAGIGVVVIKGCDQANYQYESSCPTCSEGGGNRRVVLE